MGQANEHEHHSFNTKPYQQRKPELSDREINEIHEMFENMAPINGYIDVDDIENYYSSTSELATIKNKFGMKTKANFDEFFDVIGDVLMERRSKYANVEYDSSSRNVSCLYCPYPSERKGIKA